MNSKRSYLENLNAGRQRRSGVALDEINRTLDHLESRLERALDSRGGEDQTDDIAHRMERLSSQAGIRRVPGARPARTAMHNPTPRAALERIAREIDQTRQQDQQLASIGGIAAELKTLREDMRAAMNSELRREFEGLRREVTRVASAVPPSPLASELNAELERLSEAIGRLAERSDDRSAKMLRLELEQVKATLAELAREETVRSLDKRWDAFENRLSSLQRTSDPAIERLAQRLEEISSAISGLPDSLALNSLDERVRALAGSLEQFAGQHERNQPDLYAMVEERLDEISRAITASAALAHSPGFDTSMLERIEARIGSLASQLDEVVQDRPGGVVVERLNALSERVDEIGRRIDVPEKAVERLAEQFARISEKIETAPRVGEFDEVFRGLEERFARLSELIERRQEDAIRQGQSLFQELERRLDELAERLERAGQAGGEAGIMATIDSRFAELAAHLDDRRHETGESPALRALEERLEDISLRLQNSASAAAVDPDMIRNLETQVASLAAYLAQPGHDAPGFDDLALRLESIERSIGESRAAVLVAARQAAEEAIERLAAAPVDGGLREELKSLETLTRRSDERNTKTFEAIHDTLLKIVERLGTLESGVEDLGADKISVGEAPSLDPESYREDVALSAPRRTPAEAAAAAAEAALLDDAEEENGIEPAPRTMLAGLSRAFSARRTHVEEREDPVLSSEAEDEPALDPERANEPLEPGSGAPDLNAIMRRVRDQREAHTSSAGETAKADFIAAARRAAQAAAAEAEILKKRRPDAAESSGKGLGRILRRHKRQLLLTLGIVILIAGGLQVGKELLRNEDMSLPVAQTDQPASDEPAAVSASSEPKAQEEAAPMVLEEERAADADSGQPVSTAAAPEVAPAPAPVSEEPEVAQPPATEPPVAVDEIEQTASVAPPQAAAPQPQHETPAETAIPGLPEIPAEAGPSALREAAASGNPAALYEIADRYAEGRGVSADMTEAAKWYELAAEQGLAPAEYRIGNLYEKGLGVARDIGKAKMWYQLAAEHGNVSAMHNLGVLYAMGADGTADNQQAAHWFQRAAELGVADSQFNLGILSAKGAGVPRNLVEAYKWFDIVGRTGDKDAIAKRDEIAKVMAPADLVKARGKAKLWEAREPDPKANTVDIPEAWREDGTVTGSLDMKKAIANIQLILNKNGFDAGPADGIMGERTRAAIRAFQKANGMDETGEVDDALARALLKSNEGAQ